MRRIFCVIFILIVCISCSKKISNYLINNEVIENRKVESKYLFIEGLRYKYIGQNSEALKYFEECLKKDERNDAAYYNMAEILILKEKPEEAKKYLIKAWNIDRKNIWYCIALSEMYRETGKSDSALLYMEMAQKLDPKNNDIKLMIAQLYMNNGKYKEANLIYREIEEKYGLNDENSLEIIKNYFNSKNYKDAQRVLEKLISNYPDENFYFTLLAEVYRKEGNIEKAYEIYNKIYKSGSNNPQILIWMANFLIEEKNDDLLHDIIIEIVNNEQIGAEEKIITIKKLFEDEELLKSEKLKIDELIKVTEEKLKENFVAEILRADLYEKKGKINDAEEYLKSIIKRNKKNYYAWERLLLILSEKKEYKELYYYAKECANEFNLSYLAKIIYANAAVEMGEFETALEEIRKAKIIAGNQSDGIVQAMILEADIYYKKGEYIKAFNILEEALKIDSNNLNILNNYSYYLAENESDLRKAENMIMKVLLSKPNNTVYLDTYAWILYKQGKNKKALNIMRKIIEILKGADPEYYEHYGFILKKSGKCNEALKYWQKAIEVDERKKYLEKEIESCTGNKK